MGSSVGGRQVNLGRMMMILERMWGDDSLSFSLVRKKRRGKALLCLRRSVSSQRIPSTQVPVSVLDVCARMYKCVRLEIPKGGSADWKAENNRVKEREGEIFKHSAAFPVSGRARARARERERERERETFVWRACVCVCDSVPSVRSGETGLRADTHSNGLMRSGAASRTLWETFVARTAGDALKTRISALHVLNRIPAYPSAS